MQNDTHAIIIILVNNKNTILTVVNTRVIQIVNHRASLLHRSDFAGYLAGQPPDAGPTFGLCEAKTAGGPDSELRQQRNVIWSCMCVAYSM